MKHIIFILLLFPASGVFAQSSKTEVLTLGTFHFAFRNRDIKKVDKKDQIDVLDKKYQVEIEDIVRQIVKFKPTVIAIERDPVRQHKTDSVYREYIGGTYELRRDEDEQIGFRVAKQLGLKKLYCVNDWGQHYNYIDSLLEKDTTAFNKFLQFVNHNDDSDKIFFVPEVFKAKGIKAQLRLMNDDKNHDRDLGNYLVGLFKYEPNETQFWGTDYVTGWWFNRNLRIFRNIQKIPTSPSDRILVIYGNGHMNLLNLFFKVSPEYELVNAVNYLK